MIIRLRPSYLYICCLVLGFFIWMRCHFIKLLSSVCSSNGWQQTTFIRKYICVFLSHWVCNLGHRSWSLNDFHCGGKKSFLLVLLFLWVFLIIFTLHVVLSLFSKWMEIDIFSCWLLLLFGFVCFPSVQITDLRWISFCLLTYAEVKVYHAIVQTVKKLQLFSSVSSSTQS